MTAQIPKPISPPMARLLALRSFVEHATWQSFCRAHDLDDTALYAWLRGKTVPRCTDSPAPTTPSTDAR